MRIVHSLSENQSGGEMALPPFSGGEASLADATLQLNAVDRAAANQVHAPAGAAPTDSTATAPLSDAAALLQLQARLMSSTSLVTGAQTLAAGLATALNFSRVAIGVIEHGYCRVVALSHGFAADAGSAFTAALGRAMDEAIEQQAIVTLPAQAGGPVRITLAHATLVRHHEGALVTIPLARAGRIFGAVTLQRASVRALPATDIERSEKFVCLVGPTLDLMHANEQPWHARLRERARWRDGLTGKLLAAGATLLGAALLWTPVDYWIGAPARLEGATQRAVVAPAEGFLKSVHVRPGDLVRTDQVLVEMVEQDLRLEQQKLESEVTQHENALRGALARGDRTLYATSSARADSAAAQLAMIAEQRLRSRIRAPFDGVVIKGDLTQALGAPLQRGEVLLTIAPAGEYRLIVEVDERDIPDIKPGQAGVLAVAALPGSQIEFVVVRVTPLATARDGRNFFEVEGRLDVVPSTLRPGLQGVGKILAGQRAFGWVWTHRVVDWVRLRLWSLAG